MKNALVIGGLAVAAVVVGIFVLLFLNAAAYGNRMEARLDAIVQDNENVYSTMAASIAEIANVAEESVKQQRQYLTDALAARYGSDGSQALFQWLQEQNPALNIAIYEKIAQVIESKRNEFQSAQTRMIDVKRQYVTSLGSPIYGLFLKAAGYPKVNVGYPRGTADDYQAVVNQQAREAFDTGVDQGLQPFKN